jgi:hypothetical protein
VHARKAKMHIGTKAKRGMKKIEITKIIMSGFVPQDLAGQL